MTTSEVVTESVTFGSDEVHLRGALFLPTTATRPPAVVVTGTWTSVRQQMADRYARELAVRGFAALSFDFTGFGASDGDPRDVESAALKVRDLHHAVDFLAGHAQVDGERIAALAACASAMYAALVAVEDPRPRPPAWRPPCQ